MKTVSDVCYCETHGLYLDIYLPACQNFPVFVYFHGGGLERGDSVLGKLVLELIRK